MAAFVVQKPMPRAIIAAKTGMPVNTATSSATSRRVDAKTASAGRSCHLIHSMSRIVGTIEIDPTSTYRPILAQNTGLSV